MKKPLEEVLKHATPGPLQVEDGQIKSADCVVAECCHWHGPYQDACDANAALLAHFRNIGPELVEAVEEERRAGKKLLDARSVSNEEFGRILKASNQAYDRVTALLSRAKEVEVP